MIQKILNLLYGGTPATFESSFSLEESVRRLKAATKQTSFSALTMQQAVGRVHEDKVVLERVIPFVHNSFKPVFVGQFEHTRSGIRLQGHFTMDWLAKVFLTFWFGFIVLWVGIAVSLLAASGSLEKWWLPLAGVLMLGFGFGLVRAGKYFARNDIVWLSNVIKAALSAEG